MRPDAATAAAPRHRQRIGGWADGLTRLGAVWLALVLLFLPQWQAMAHQWWSISTYSHILLIPAILIWLVWQRREGLRRFEPQGWWPGLAAFAAALLLWVTGSLAGIAEAQQAGAVAMLIAVVPLLLGPRIAMGLAFPLAYMLFLVPVGDEAIPLMQTVDARLTVALLHASGIRAGLDGVFITTPAGAFEIAEACSGVKFLVAMIAFGVLAAHVCFVSRWRRAAFLAAAIVIPVLANGLRSWGTVYLAQFVGAGVAGGFDHIVYGWIFFALVIGGTLALSWRFFDRPARAPLFDADALAGSRRLARLECARAGALPILVALLALVLGARAWTAAAARMAAPLPARIALPAVPGWHRTAYAPRPWFEPRAAGAAHRLIGRYADAAGDAVDVFVALYAAQGPDAKADGTGEGAVRRESGWVRQGSGPGFADAFGDRLAAPGAPQRLAETSFANSGQVTGSRIALRLADFANKLLLRPRPTMLLVLSAEPAPQRSPFRQIAAFRAAIGPLGPWLGAIGRGTAARPQPSP